MSHHQPPVHTLGPSAENVPLWTPDEAAAYLGVTRATLSIWRCTARYKLTYIKVGRLVRYRKSDCDAFLGSRTVGA